MLLFDMRNVVPRPVGIGAYILLLLLLHVVPLGPADVNQYGVGGLRADYCLHALVFLPWMFLGPFRRRPAALPLPKTARAAAWLGLGIVAAVFLEGLQYSLPYRSFNPLDAVFNAAGVTAGALMWLRLRRRGLN